MRFVNSTLMLFVSLALLVTACGTVPSAQIPNVKLYKPIPFIDGEEAVYIETVTHKEGAVSAEEWAKKKPYLFALDDEGWATIKTSWLQACQMAIGEGGNCNIVVDSIAGTIQNLDTVAAKIFGGL